jgi:hypothetical protein
MIEMTSFVWLVRRRSVCGTSLMEVKMLKFGPAKSSAKMIKLKLFSLTRIA